MWTTVEVLSGNGRNKPHIHGFILIKGECLPEARRVMLAYSRLTGRSRSRAVHTDVLKTGEDAFFWAVYATKESEQVYRCDHMVQATANTLESAVRRYSSLPR